MNSHEVKKMGDRIIKDAARNVTLSLWYGVLVVLVGLSSGCAADLARETTPVYPVFINERGQGPALCVSVRLLPPSSGSKGEKSTLRVIITNHTGRDIFLARIGEYPLTQLRVDVRYEGGAIAFASGPRMAGCKAPFDYIIDMTPFEGQREVECDKPMQVGLIASVGSSDKARYADLTVEFPLIYYALGATTPAGITVKRTVRVPYRDTKTPSEKLPAASAPAVSL